MKLCDLDHGYNSTKIIVYLLMFHVVSQHSSQLFGISLRFQSRSSALDRRVNVRKETPAARWRVAATDVVPCLTYVVCLHRDVAFSVFCSMRKADILTFLGNLLCR